MKRRQRYAVVLTLMFAVLVITGTALYSANYRKGILPLKIPCGGLREGPDPGKRILEIKDAVSGNVYGRWALEETGEFAIEFIHSVNQSPVHESFGVEGGLIRPLAVRFSSFGAGMQSDLEEGMSFAHDGDTMILTGFNSSFRELSYIVGTVSDHLLLVNGETISLRELCGRNANITIQIK